MFSFAEAYRDQEMARLFGECGWTQEKIAGRINKKQQWVSRRLIFGRFLSSTPTGVNHDGLTERRFRDYWQRTKGKESERFAQVADILAHGIRLHPGPSSPILARGTRRDRQAGIATPAAAVGLAVSAPQPPQVEAPITNSGADRPATPATTGVVVFRGARFRRKATTHKEQEKMSRKCGTPQHREFRPKQVILAFVYQCNLSCPHCCVPIEWPDRLDIPTAIRFLEQARATGIERLGFTGGEPFLYPEFLVALTRRGAELGFRFDKLMTNGVWYPDEPHLERVLGELRDAGFAGKIGLSVDKFHGIATAKLAAFCRVARRVFARDTILSLSYASRAPDVGLEPIRKLASELDAVIEWSDLLHRYMLVSDELTMTLCWNHLATVERAEALPGDPWDGAWFEEDYCEGPGQALIVNPRGEVKPCCGFASDLDQLTIGNIYTDSVGEIIANARNHPYVGKVFREGLTTIRDEIIARDPSAIPGATSNQCYFCWYVLTRGMASGVNGGGGKVGGWTGEKPNFTGELIRLGVKK